MGRAAVYFGLAVAAVGVARAQTPITVVNANFETPSLCPGSFFACASAAKFFGSGNGLTWISPFPAASSHPPFPAAPGSVGWSTVFDDGGPTGVYIPSLGQYPNGGVPDALTPVSVNPEDRQVAFVAPSGAGQDIRQQVGVVQADTYYSLSVGVGVPKTFYDNTDGGPPFNTAGIFSVKLMPASGSPLLATSGATGPGGLPFGSFSNVLMNGSTPIGSPSIGLPLFIDLGASFGEVDYDNVILTATTTTNALNEFIPLPTTASTGFTIVLAGDVRDALDPAAIKTLRDDPLTNPWAYLGDAVGLGATLDSDGNTDLTWISPFAITSHDSFCAGGPPCNGLPHFGFDTGDACLTLACTPLNMVGQFWTDEATDELPSLTVGDPTLTGPTVAWGIFYANVTAGGSTVGQWFEVPYTTDNYPLFHLTNSTGQAETLSNVGFFLSYTTIPLDELNFADFAPPGDAGSRFTDIPELDGLILDSGASRDFVATPEPSSFVLAAIGLLFLAALTCPRARRAM